MLKYSILPLLGILQISEFSYQISSNSELAVIFSGFITAMLIGIVYCSPFALLAQKIRNGKSLSRKLLIILLTSSIALMIGILINNPIILMFTTSLFIISTIVGFSFLIPTIIISYYKKLNISSS